MEREEIRKFKTSHKKAKYEDDDHKLFIEKNHIDSEDLDYFEREYEAKKKNKSKNKKINTKTEINNYFTKNNSGDFVYNKIIKN
jgi:hypothetical protein